MTNADERHTGAHALHERGHEEERGKGRGERVPQGVRLVRLPGGVPRWGALVVACLVTLLGGGLATAGMARADTIDGAITSITTTATHTAQWDRVDFGCTWAVPDGSAPGDTFSLQLPPQLRWFGSADFDLKAPDGQVVAHAHAGADGLVVFTLTDYVLANPVDVHGSCRFSTQYVAETTDETVHLDFHVGDQVVRVDLGTDNPCPTTCATSRTDASKYLWWHDTAQTVTHSVILAPATTTDHSDVTIEDVPGPGLALDCSTLAPTIGTVLDARGEVTAPRDDALYPPTTTCTPQRATVTWTGVPAGEYTELRIAAQVTDPALATYTNAGTVTVDGHTTPVHDDVRRSDAGGDGDGTPSPTTTTSTSTTSTTTSPTPSTTTSSTTSPTTTTSSTTSTSPTTTSSSTSTTPSTTAIGSGTFTSPAVVGTVTTTGGGEVTAPTSSASSLAFTGVDAVRLAVVAVLLLTAGFVVSALGRRGRRH